MPFNQEAKPRPALLRADVERLEGYRPGGYHPVQLNNRLQERYSIIEKLGHGSYSTIWLARDERLSRYVASGCLIPPVFDRFELIGPNGIHSCLVTTPARCIVFGLCLDAANLSQISIHLSNLLLQLPGKEIDKLTVKELCEKYSDPEAEPVLGKYAEEVTLSEAKLMLTDLGTAFSPVHETRLQSFTPRKTRPPEPRFDPMTPLSPFLDIFLPELDDWKRFVANGQPTEGRQPWTFDQRFEDAIQGPRQRRKGDTMDERESKAFCELIRDILNFRPGERPTAEGILRSQWMTEWALRDAEKTWASRD
ncbi:kinase domain-containing protein [Verticillium dahliae]|nr:kinase domain-containing protein [Verticillium dahliae]